MATIAEMLRHPPSFVLIEVRALGRRLGIYGAPGIHSPWMDTLGYQGMRFTAADGTGADALDALLPALSGHGYAISRHDGLAAEVVAAAKGELQRWAGSPERPFCQRLVLTDLIANDDRDVIEEVDLQVGRFVDDFDDRGMDEDTLIALIGSGAQAALILRWSSILPGGWTGDQPVALADLAATLADLAGVPAANGGASFRSLLEGIPVG